MRMTNEEFQAEVFRRSQVYMQQKRSRRTHMFRAATVFAACFVLVAGGLVIRNTFSKDFAMSNTLSADQAVSYAESSLKEDCAAEASEEYALEAEQAAEALEQYMQQAGTSNGKRGDSKDAKKSDVAAANAERTEENSEEEAESEDSSSEKDEMLSVADYLEALGIRQPPETLWGYSLEWDPDARYLLNERNAFVYPDEQRRVMLTVYLYPIPENAPDDGEIYIFHSEEGQTADFIVGKAQVSLIGNGMEAGDITTLRDIAQELKSSLEK